MRRIAAMSIVFSVVGCGMLLAQQTSEPDASSPGPNQPLPRSSAPQRSVNESSSRQTIIDLSPPADDSKEFHPYDPHKAEKDVEVADFYFKRGNYRAATERYREALEYKPNDAASTIGLAQALEKQGNKDEAAPNTGLYRKIWLTGPRAEEARKGLRRTNPMKRQESVSRSQ